MRTILSCEFSTPKDSMLNITTRFSIIKNDSFENAKLLYCNKLLNSRLLYINSIFIHVKNRSIYPERFEEYLGMLSIRNNKKS